MANNFTTSVNILRDTERDFNYIPTPNAKQVVGQIVNDFKKGIRSFNIIGTYGTGKSSFLLALEQSVNGSKRYFEANFIAPNPKVDFVKIIGSYSSIIEQFADIFEVTINKNKHENILSAIYNRYHELGKSNKILFLLLDEFGKFLEYASKHNPENELYFIQQLAEFCNNPKHNIILISTVHQSFESYAYSLTSTQKQEWTKVKGRFREITFNEPVEQLLYLASEYVAENFESKPQKGQVEQCLKLVEASKAFNLNKDFVKDIAIKLFPLDILAANILTLSLQRYGQNERSLFSFLESTDHTGLSKFNKRENPFYNLSFVYDYINFNFYSFITSKYNPDFSAWGSIRSSLEEIERGFDSDISDYAKAVKIIGLLNIFCASGTILDGNFLIGYLETACGISEAKSVIQKLESKKLIRYRTHSKRYILFEGTDLDIQTALIEAGNKISEVSDITALLNKYFQFTPVFAKLYSYEIGTPRFFEFKISEYPIDIRPEGEIDGFINLIFNSKLKITEIEEASKSQSEAIVYCFFKNSTEIKNLLFEIEKIEKVIEENKEDKVARRELENIADSQKRLLNHYIIDSIYSGSKEVKWFFKGVERKIADKKDFNKLLSQICRIIYDATPVFKNELVNKHKISASIHSAKRNYFKALANNWDKVNLDFDELKFPPEKTIYLSLLKENGISPIRENHLDIISIDKQSSFNKLWEISEKFLESAKSDQKIISEFVEILCKRPFKLKQGLIDFWIPTFLFIRREDFALFNESGYVPSLSDENLELIAKNPKNYSIKTFDIEGVKLDIFNSYRAFLNQSKETKFDNISFIETIKPFIVFYKQLPEYSKQTKRLSAAALKIRQAIATSKNPEETFFESFPNALGISLNNLQKDKTKLQSYTTSLQNAVRELRTSYDGLVVRIEEFICNEFVGKVVDFDEYKNHLQKRYANLKKHLLLTNQKTFIQRIDSSLDDKKAWLNSIAQSVVGKTLENFTDEDEIILYDNFKSLILDLDSLTNISKADIDESAEDVIGVKIDTFFSNINPKIVRVPKNKTQEIEKLKVGLKKKLGTDKTSNIAAVLNLLKELLQ
jgi:ribosomal protein S15P/S13E